jgi:hypothetical protein
MMTVMDNDTIRKLLADATPGPWTARRKTHKSGAISHRLDGDNWCDFTRIWVRGRDDTSIHEDGLANARLIAAAPDLAAEVLRLRDAIEEATHPDFIFGAMDNVNDMDVSLDDFAHAVSRAIRAAMKDTAP